MISKQESFYRDCTGKQRVVNRIVHRIGEQISPEAKQALLARMADMRTAI
jgi:hypothetical protein